MFVNISVAVFVIMECGGEYPPPLSLERFVLRAIENAFCVVLNSWATGPFARVNVVSLVAGNVVKRIISW